jgi:hypothetical protein
MGENTVQLIVVFGLIGICAVVFALLLAARDRSRRQRDLREDEPRFEPRRQRSDDVAKGAETSPPAEAE